MRVSLSIDVDVICMIICTFAYLIYIATQNYILAGFLIPQIILFAHHQYDIEFKKGLLYED